MQDITGSVLGVSGRTTRNNRQMYDVAFSDGNKYTTFDAALATKAQGLQGQQVTARVEVSQNGQYTNYNLRDIAPIGQLPPQAFPAAPGAPLPAGGSPTPSPSIPTPQIASVPFLDEAARQQSIVRQSSLKTAFQFVGSLFHGAGPEAMGEARELALVLGRDLFMIAHYGHENHAPQTPQEIAAGVNTAVGVPAVQVGVDTPPETSTIQW